MTLFIMSHVCVICLELVNFRTEQNLRLECHHIFHTECLLNYFLHVLESININNPLTCPMCRLNVDITILQSYVNTYHIHLNKEYRVLRSKYRKLKIELFITNLKYLVRRVVKFKSMNDAYILLTLRDQQYDKLKAFENHFFKHKERYKSSKLLYEIISSDEDYA